MGQTSTRALSPSPLVFTHFPAHASPPSTCPAQPAQSFAPGGGEGGTLGRKTVCWGPPVQMWEQHDPEPYDIFPCRSTGLSLVSPPASLERAILRHRTGCKPGTLALLPPEKKSPHSGYGQLLAYCGLSCLPNPGGPGHQGFLAATSGGSPQTPNSWAFQSPSFQRAALRPGEWRGSA